MSDKYISTLLAKRNTSVLFFLVSHVYIDINIYLYKTERDIGDIWSTIEIQMHIQDSGTHACRVWNEALNHYMVKFVFSKASWQHVVLLMLSTFSHMCNRTMELCTYPPSEKKSLCKSAHCSRPSLFTTCWLLREWKTSASCLALA